MEARKRAWVKAMNTVMKEKPHGCMAYMMAGRTGLFTTGSAVCGAVGLPADLAIAFAATRPLKKVRMPLDVAAACGVAKMVPVLTEVRVSHLLGIVGAPTFLDKYPKLTAMWEKSNELIDRYGAAYYIARDMVGVSVIVAFYMALSVDPFGITASILNYTGVTEATAATFSAMAGGAVLSSTVSPALLASLPRGVEYLNQHVDIDAAIARHQKRLEEAAAQAEAQRAKEPATATTATAAPVTEDSKRK